MSADEPWTASRWRTARRNAEAPPQNREVVVLSGPPESTPAIGTVLGATIGKLLDAEAAPAGHGKIRRVTAEQKAARAIYVGMALGRDFAAVTAVFALAWNAWGWRGGAVFVAVALTAGALASWWLLRPGARS